MILAHEYGHQLQYIFGLPSVMKILQDPTNWKLTALQDII
jgi:hypothetical protein